MLLVAVLLTAVEPQLACDRGDGAACLEAAAQLRETDPGAAAELTERAARLGEVTPPAPPTEAVAHDDDLRELGPAAGPVSRFGGVAYAAVAGSTRGPGFVGGLGLRVSLRERVPEQFMFLPGLALVGGVVYDREGLSPWLDTRFELMGAPGWNLLQPVVSGFVSTGVTFHPQAAMQRGSVVRPYVGAGTGWMWPPSFTSNAASFSALAFLAFLCAGRVEVRVAPPLGRADSTEVTFIAGVGL